MGQYKRHSQKQEDMESPSQKPSHSNELRCLILPSKISLLSQ